MSRPTLLVEFVHPDGSPVLLAELGLAFIERHGLPMANATKPFRVEIEGKTSKAGNVHYTYEHGGVPLPDGFDTCLRVAGEDVALGPPRTSKAGNLTREGRSSIRVGDLDYDLLVYLTKGKSPYWVKVHAQKAAKRAGTTAALNGGRIV